MGMNSSWGCLFQQGQLPEHLQENFVQRGFQKLQAFTSFGVTGSRSLRLAAPNSLQSRQGGWSRPSLMKEDSQPAEDRQKMVARINNIFMDFKGSILMNL